MQKYLDLIYFKRKEIISITIILVLVIIILFQSFHNDKEIEINESNIIEKKESKLKEVDIEKIIVDIKGEINKPGIYEMNNGNRIIDVITKAGGLTKSADTNSINLSEKIVDEMVIIIPTLNINNTSELTDKKVINDLPKDKRISINTASIDELMTIKGIGTTKAKKIIEYRNKNGKFKKIEDIKKVSGIGNSTFEKIKNYIKI